MQHRNKWVRIPVTLLRLLSGLILLGKVWTPFIITGSRLNSITAVLLSEWSPLVLLFSSLPAPSPILWGLSQVHQLQLLSLSPSCSIVCFFGGVGCSLVTSKYLSLFSLSFYFTLWSAETVKSNIRQVLFFFFCWLSLRLVDWPRLGDLFVSQNPRKLCVCQSPEQILSYAYITCAYGQIKISQWIPLPPSHQV